jgi:hypothetical protein
MKTNEDVFTLAELMMELAQSKGFQPNEFIVACLFCFEKLNLLCNISPEKYFEFLKNVGEDYKITYEKMKKKTRKHMNPYVYCWMPYFTPPPPEE